jgi:hypothetical protein
MKKVERGKMFKNLRRKKKYGKKQYKIAGK